MNTCIGIALGIVVVGMMLHIVPSLIALTHLPDREIEELERRFVKALLNHFTFGLVRRRPLH